MQWHLPTLHRILCTTDKAAWRTPKIRMQNVDFYFKFDEYSKFDFFFDSPSGVGWVSLSMCFKKNPYSGRNDKGSYIMIVTISVLVIISIL